MTNLDWSNFDGPKRNADWKPDLQDLIYTAINFRDDEYGDADEDAGQQIVERLLSALRDEIGDKVMFNAHRHELLEKIDNAGWLPIAEADKDIAYIHDMAGLRIGGSHPISVRDEDGRVYEALWSDDGKRAYWWDIEGESPVDPVEFMPHPLDPRFATPTSASGGDHG